MVWKKRIEPGEKVPLKLSATERKLLFAECLCLDPEHEHSIQTTPTGQPLMLSLDALDDLLGHVAAAANHCEDQKKERALDAIFERIERLLDKYTDEETGEGADDQRSVVTAVELQVTGKSSKPAKARKDTTSQTRQKKTRARASGNAAETLYQFKITLLDSRPAIWRRIQVLDCTLDKLHERIQTAMGWTNSHLNQFVIKGKRYGDPELLSDGFDDFDGVDSRKTMISDVIPNASKQFTFTYEYDFGDGWQHEVRFECRPTTEKGKKYPVCLEGQRACPPEDVGGVWGYENFLAAIADPKHEEHEDFLEWCGGSFSPERFDASAATRRMVKGLPDWRSMR